MYHVLRNQLLSSGTLSTIMKFSQPKISPSSHTKFFVHITGLPLENSSPSSNVLQ